MITNERITSTLGAISVIFHTPITNNESPILTKLYFIFKQNTSFYI